MSDIVVIGISAAASFITSIVIWFLIAGYRRDAKQWREQQDRRQGGRR